MRNLKFGFLLSLAVVAGCAVGPNYHRPAVNAPAQFRGAEGQPTNSLGDLAWWQLFRDPALQGLVQAALTNNYDLQTAAARVDEARAVLAQARSGFYPQVGYEAGVGMGRNVTGGAPSDNGGGAGGAFLWDVGASWEIDMWGRIRRLSEAARARYFASQEAQRDAQVSLIATVASDYFQLLALDEQLGIAKQSTNAFGESWRIFSERLRGGVASKLETSSAEAALASAAATIPEFRRQIIAEEDQINILLGRNPGPITRPTNGLAGVTLPAIPPGLPSALLERRPDIRESEQLLRAATAQIGVAKANFYPQLSLTGLFGEVSPQFTALTSGGANAWEAAAGLAGPIFEGGLLRGELRQARAQAQEARWQYLGSLVQAFGEVANALADREQLAVETGAREEAVQAYTEAAQVAEQRYRGGQSSYYELLQEQLLLFPAQTSLTQTRLDELLSTVQLYRALGGGWTNTPPAQKSR